MTADPMLFSPDVLACSDWSSNGALIADVARLHFPDDPHVLDPTFGRGRWWTEYTPTRFTTHDLAQDGTDFRDLPHSDKTFDVVAFDPPYVPGGSPTPTTPNMAEYLDRYGLSTVTRNTTELRSLIMAGLAECTRVTKRGGLVLVKCQPFVNGRVFVPMPAYVVAEAERLGLRPVDEFVHRRTPGPLSQVPQRGRRNHSNLLVFARRHKDPAS